MIKNTEIRIGNWIMSSDGPFQVYSEIFNDIEYNEAMFEPIPLTHEILVKMGFNNGVPNDSGLRTSFLNGHLFFMENGRFKYFVGYAPILQFDGINYVHQLQNLFYFLTNTELQFEL